MYFSVAAGVGVHAELIYNATGLLKRRGGFAAYYLAGLSLLVSHNFTPFSAERIAPAMRAAPARGTRATQNREPTWAMA